MNRRVFRVCRARFARLDGEGARRAGGRWNSPGTRVVYMAESIALAVLENLVHMSRVDFPTGYVVVGAAIPEHLPIITEDELAGMFGNLDSPRLGDLWIESNASAILAVHSVVVPSERNFLLNPRHPRFGDIVVEIPVPFQFDERLFKAV